MQGQTTCPYCGVGCGVDAKMIGPNIIATTGTPDHPANLGRLCVKGTALAQTLGSKGRLEQPQVDGVHTSWEIAISEAARRWQAFKPESTAMYLSGQLLTEDYYIANKLMKGFIGSPHVDTNSRLCMASTVAGYKRAFGEDVQPCCYEDIEQADLVLLVGSNAAWNHPVLFQRLRQAKADNPDLRVVIIDPRRTATADIADLHLAIEPGQDTALFNQLLREMEQRGCVDHDFVAQHTQGFEAALAAATDTVDLDLAPLIEWLCSREKTLTLFSQGVNQSASGTDKVNAIINLHLATGRIGRPGMGPFSLTGQPNAMGGREVGGLANQLAAHMSVADRDLVGEFWQAPNMISDEGYKAVEMFEAIESGEIQAVWIMATNPAFSLPGADRVREALRRCPLVIVSECMADADMLEIADIVLPATGWGEKDGTVTNSERCISRQRGLVPGPGQAKHDWQIIRDFAHAMGHADHFQYAGPADIFREHAALSGHQNAGARYFDISALKALSDAEYESLTPIQWPVTAECPAGTQRAFTDYQFPTPSGKANFIPTAGSELKSKPTHPAQLLVNSGRIRDQWHSMTRTGRAPELMRHRSEPFIEIHPKDAARFELPDQSLAVLSNPQGRYVGRIRTTVDQRPGEVFIPMHWSRHFASDSNCSNLFSANTDPVSGQPESKAIYADLKRLPVRWHAHLVTAVDSTSPLESLEHWNRITLDSCQALRVFSTAEHFDEWPETPNIRANMADGGFRAARVNHGQLQWMLWVSPVENELPSIDSWNDLFRAPLSVSQRANLLRTPVSTSSETICSCFGVDRQRIQDAIEDGVETVEGLGAALKCGTNCGSCIPELNQMLNSAQLTPG